MKTAVETESKDIVIGSTKPNADCWKDKLMERLMKKKER